MLQNLETSELNLRGLNLAGCPTPVTGSPCCCCHHEKSRERMAWETSVNKREAWPTHPCPLHVPGLKRNMVLKLCFKHEMPCSTQASPVKLNPGLIVHTGCPQHCGQHLSLYSAYCTTACLLGLQVDAAHRRTDPTLALRSRALASKLVFWHVKTCLKDAKAPQAYPTAIGL